MAEKTVEYQQPEIEQLDRDEMLALQDRKLAAMGARLAQSPDWCAHLGKAGLHPKDLADRQALAAVPTLEKKDLHHLYPFPMLTVPTEQVIRFFATSGTTGPPVLFGFSRRDLEELLAAQMSRVLRTAGFRPGDRVFQGHSYGMWIGGPAVDIGLQALGATNFPIGPGRAELAVTWMRDHAYTACFMSPLWLIHLAKVAVEQGLDPRTDWKSLRVGAVGGMSVTAGLLDAIAAPMADGFQSQVTYGTTEAGGPILGASCPYSRDDYEMHLINDDTVMTEILDPDTLMPVGPGEVGEIVITTLDKEASPVLRWRTRDLVRLSNKPYDCPCGRKGLGRFSLIIGRSDDMLKIRGTIVFPSQVEDVVATTEGAVTDAWQIYVDKKDLELDAATVAVERQRSAEISPEVLAENVGRALRSRTGVRLEVECHEEGALPRYEGKAVRVLVKD